MTRIIKETQHEARDSGAAVFPPTQHPKSKHSANQRLTSQNLITIFIQTNKNMLILFLFFLGQIYKRTLFC